MGSWEVIGITSQAVFMILQAVFTKISRAFDENENEREKKIEKCYFPIYQRVYLGTTDRRHGIMPVFE